MNNDVFHDFDYSFLFFVAMQCDPYCSNYDACISPCPLDTCDNVLDQGKEQRMCQGDSCVEGCRIKPCQDGFIYKNDSFTECVPESVCRPICLETNGVVYYEGDIMESDSCHSCRCTRGKSVCIGEPCRTGRLEDSVTQAPIPLDIIPPGAVGPGGERGQLGLIGKYLPQPKLTCKEGWSTWFNIDRIDYSQKNTTKTTTQPRGLKIGDTEPIPNFQQLVSAINNTAYCELKNVQGIDCRTALTHQNPKATGQDVECSIEKGLVCSGLCHDFEIRVLCVCKDPVPAPSTPKPVFSPVLPKPESLPQMLPAGEPEKLLTITTVAPPPEFCDMSVPHTEFPGDCYKFKQCFLTGRGSEYVVKTCGPNMMYHPINMVCDWPASVIEIKPDCGLLENLTTTTLPPTTTPRVSNILIAAGLKENMPCDIILEKPYLDYPGDCQKYQQCAPSPKGGYRYITQTCGEGMMFNPTNNICDWPTTVKLIKPECDGIKRQPESVTNAPVAPLAAPTPKQSVASVCEPGFIWSDCALPCGRACDYYGKYLRKTGHCDSTSNYCVAGCVETESALACPPGYLWRDRKGCVKKIDCTCMSRSGKVIRPGEVVNESECEVCQCIDNVYICNDMDCDDEEIGRSLDEDELILGRPNKTTTTIKLPPGVTTATPLITKSVVTPPPKCDPSRFIPLIEGSNPMPDSAITASSTLGQYYKPQYARLHSRPTTESSGAWSPEDNNVNQYIQVEFVRPLPVYGVVLKGSPTFNSFVTSYNIMYSIDGIVYHIITDGNKQLVFSGPIDPRNPVQQVFPNPIEAKTIRVIPLTWNENIAIRLEFLGCAKEIPTTTTPLPVTQQPFEIPTTMLPYVEEEEIEPLCIDPMGLDNGKLAPNQIKVSSTKPLKLKKNQKIRPFDLLQLSSPKGWSPILNSLNEFVIVSIEIGISLDKSFSF